MSNRETYPASQSPLQGDVSGEAGNTTVTVVGLQTQPLSPAVPVDKDTLRYNISVPAWEPTADGNASVTLGTFSETGGEVTSKGINISDDYEFLVDNVGLDVLVGWPYGFASQVFVDGSPI
jgi:hypothetical protein